MELHQFTSANLSHCFICEVLIESELTTVSQEKTIHPLETCMKYSLKYCRNIDCFYCSVLEEPHVSKSNVNFLISLHGKNCVVLYPTVLGRSNLKHMKIDRELFFFVRTVIFFFYRILCFTNFNTVCTTLFISSSWLLRIDPCRHVWII